MDIAALSPLNQSAASGSSSRLSADFDTFLTLLTTQLRNQDPLKPLDTEKFTEQLVQFAGVEQSIQTNQNLEALIALQSSSDNETALAMVGRDATVKTDVASFTGGEARWTYELANAAAGATAQIVDSRGTVVATGAAHSEAGSHSFVWDGRQQNGATAADGAYRLVISAVDANEAALPVEVRTRGRVDAVAFDAAGPQIEIAGQRFSLDLVSRIDARL